MIELITTQICKPYVCEKIFTIDECQKIKSQNWRDLLIDHKINYGNDDFKEMHNERLVKCGTLNYNIHTAWIFQRIINEVTLINSRQFNYNLTQVIEPIMMMEYFCQRSYDPIRHQYNSNDVRLYGLPRKLICNVLLSDNFSGGEFSLFTNDFEIVPEQIGHAVIFPSYKLHQMAPIKHGNKFVLSLSFFGLPLK